jgi:hypothetical protein
MSSKVSIDKTLTSSNYTDTVSIVYIYIFYIFARECMRVYKMSYSRTEHLRMRYWVILTFKESKSCYLEVLSQGHYGFHSFPVVD